MNTSVTYISGIPGGRVPQRRFLNYGAMTDGEMRLALIAEQLRLLGGFYNSSEHLENEQAIMAALQDGISKGSTRIRVPGELAQQLNKEIARARRKKRPAAGEIIGKREAITGIGNPLIEVPDCQHLMHYSEAADEAGYDPYTPTPAYNECRQRRHGIMLLNEHLEGSSNHMLYEFIATSESNAVLVSKSVLHSIAVGKLAEITSIDRDNLRLWTRNGIMRNNASQVNGQPVQPEDVIATMRASRGREVSPLTELTSGQGRQPAEVGVLPAFLSILPALIAAIGSAVGATVALIGTIQQNKRQELLSATNGMGTQNWGPRMEDFLFDQNTGAPPPTNNTDGNTPGTGSDLLSGDNAPLLLGAAAAFLLMSNK